MAIKTYSAFREPSPYEQEARRAEQQRRLAEMLQQASMAEQGDYTFQGIRAMPSPAAALAKMLNAYGSKKALEKAEEAESRAKGMEEQTASQIAGRLMGGAPLSSVDTTPDASGLAEVAVQSQYRQAPEEAQRLAMTPVGAAATKGNPMLAAMLARTMEKPEAEEFYAPTETAEGLVQFGKRGSRRDTGVKAPTKSEAGMTEYQREMLGLRKRDVELREARAATGRGLSPTVQKEIFDTDENILAVETGMDLLDQAMKLSPVAYEGVGASQRATAATMLPDALEPSGTKETLEFDLLLKQQVLPQLKSIFGAAPTEGERAILLELQGSSSLPKKTRESVLKRAKDAARRRLDFNKNKAQQLREGSYFSEQAPAALPDGFDLE